MSARKQDDRFAQGFARENGRRKTGIRECAKIAGHLKDDWTHGQRIRQREKSRKRALFPVRQAILPIRERAEVVLEMRELERAKARFCKPVRKKRG